MPYKILFWIFFVTVMIPQSQCRERQNKIQRYNQNDVKINDKPNCSTKFSNEIIQLIVDYALWRNIAFLYIVDESISSEKTLQISLQSDDVVSDIRAPGFSELNLGCEKFVESCNMKAIRNHLDCFNQNGLSIALQRKIQSTMFKSGSYAKRAMIVSFVTAEIDLDNYLDVINLISTWDGYFNLLNIFPVVYKNISFEHLVLETLRSSQLTLSVDVSLAIATSNHSTETTRKMYMESCKRLQSSLKNWETSQSKETWLLPFNKTLQKNETFNVTFQDLCGPKRDLYENSFCMLQIYKIRKSNNASLVFRPLGNWNFATGTERLNTFQSVDARTNFYGFSLIFGKKQFSQDANVVADESLIEDTNDEENMDKISEFISLLLNATQKVKMYPNLGLKGPSGNWSGLLGAVVSQEVDIGLDSVIKVPERYNDMAFTQDIMVSIRNIYLKPEQSHSVRDIFYAPFDSKLIISVLGTGIIFAIAMTVYIINYNRHSKKQHTSNPYVFAISDAMLWIVGVFTMQGSQIQPGSYSGNIIIVISLLFALIIYNAYSAFITSMLSVKLTQIRTVEDLLNSDYDIGYTKNSQDEIFLRSLNQSQLNQIYLRGYLHNNINNITDGLLKATKGNYGFFATEHAARKQFLKISNYKCKYDIMEIPVGSTKNMVAFPMSQTSPYRRAINFGLIKMSEGGVHQYILSLIAPSLPKCDQKSSYQSARFNDLITSFGLLALGIFAGITTVLVECFWKKKRLIYFKLRRTYKTIDKNLGYVQ